MPSNASGKVGPCRSEVSIFDVLAECAIRNLTSALDEEGWLERVLNRLVAEMKNTYGDNLVALFLYGSAASGDFHDVGTLQANFQQLEVVK